jgi:hypothetical protein
MDCGCTHHLGGQSFSIWTWIIKDGSPLKYALAQTVMKNCPFM